MMRILHILIYIFIFLSYSLCASNNNNKNKKLHNKLNAWPDPYNKTEGQIWPLPQKIEIKNKTWFIDFNNFVINSDSECDIIKEAIKRYTKPMIPPIHNVNIRNKNEQEYLKSLTIIVESGCPKSVPQLGMDESYKMDITTNNATLKSAQVWGALRGLESFSHMVFYNKQYGHRIQAAIVKDYPRFPHRGVLLDTARHFLSINAIKANIELMAQNKFNVFHWHIVDSESFPYGSQVIPQLTQGAYTSEHIYTIDQIKDVVAYARLRGIRVIPEFDTPGHMKSWGKGINSLVTRCFDKTGKELSDQSLIDPTQEETWDVLLALFKEVSQVFPENYIHLGGDETEFWIPQCWENNKNVTDFMKLYDLKTVRDLEHWYFTKLLQILRGPRIEKKNKFVVWQEVLDMGIDIEGALVHVWKGSTKEEQMQKMKEVTSRGHYAILSSCWYLDHIALIPEWIQYYQCDPQEFDGTPYEKSLVLGGEAALWGEWVDDSNIIPRLWPRASAVAERLWSAPENIKNTALALPRLYEMQCRMASRGYPVQPVNGPGFCDFEFRLNLPTMT